MRMTERLGGRAAWVLLLVLAGCLAGDQAGGTKQDGGVCLAGGAATRSRDNGQACGCAADCRSGHCVDGRCCNTECGGTCSSCALPTALGTCTQVPDGVAPRKASECPAEAASTCGRDGLCDGIGHCRTHP